MKRLRLSKQDWIREGFSILSEFAQDKIRILYLCKRLKVTRGSFYHHFESIDDYVNCLLQAWQEENTERFIQAAEGGGTAEDKMEALDELVFDTDNAVEAAIRSWSFYSDIVQRHVKKVDEQRIAYLTGVFKQMGASAENAPRIAKLEYATLIGIQQLYPAKFDEEVRQLYTLHTRLMRGMNK